MLHWTEKYLAIPYDKMNCAEFIEHVLNKEFGKSFSFPKESGSIEKKTIAINKEISNYLVETSKPKTGDCILMNSKYSSSHVGLFINDFDKPMCLHSIQSGGYSYLHAVTELPKYSLSVVGYYTWLK